MGLLVGMVKSILERLQKVGLETIIEHYNENCNENCCENLHENWNEYFFKKMFPGMNYVWIILVNYVWIIDELCVIYVWIIIELCVNNAWSALFMHIYDKQCTQKNHYNSRIIRT